MAEAATILHAWKLDAAGRCCLKQPIAYRRPPHLFCDRCNRSYDADTGVQIQNWAFKAVDGGFPPAGAREAVAVQDTYFVDQRLPIMAMSGDVESDRVPKLHYRRKVTDEDRSRLVEVLNAGEKALAHPAPEAVAEAGPVAFVPESFFDWLTPHGVPAECALVWKEKAGAYSVPLYATPPAPDRAAVVDWLIALEREIAPAWYAKETAAIRKFLAHARSLSQQTGGGE